MTMIGTIVLPGRLGQKQGAIPTAVQGSRETVTLKLVRLDDAPFDITGAVLTGTFAAGEDIYEVTGVLTPNVDQTGENMGLFTWARSAADVGTPADYQVQIHVVIAGVPYKSFEAKWSVVASQDATAVAPPGLVNVPADHAAYLSTLIATVPDASDLIADASGDGLWVRFRATGVGSWLQGTAVGAALFAAVDAAAARSAIGAETAGAATAAQAAAIAASLQRASNLSDVANATTARGNIGAEAALGNPGVDGQSLVSTTGGVRSWASVSAADRVAKAGDTMTGTLNLSPGSDDTANLIKIPVTDATNGDVNFNMAISDFNGVKDVVFSWGFNQTIGGAKEDAALHNWFLQLENNYNFSGSDWVEYHLNLTPVSGSGFRPFQYQYKKDGTSGLIVFKTSSYDVYDLTGVIQGFTVSFGATAAASRTDFFVPVGVRDARQFTMHGGAISLQNAPNTKTLVISNDADFFYINHGSGASGGLYFQNWTYINFANVVDIRPGTWISFSKNIWMNSDANIVINSTNGMKIGTGVNEKIGVWNKTPVVQPVMATGTGKTVDDLITMLQSIGWCRQS